MFSGIEETSGEILSPTGSSAIRALRIDLQAPNISERNDANHLGVFGAVASSLVEPNALPR